VGRAVTEVGDGLLSGAGVSTTLSAGSFLAREQLLDHRGSAQLDHRGIRSRPCGIRSAEALGCEAIQVFVGNPRGWALSPGRPTDDVFRDECARRGLRVVIHTAVTPPFRQDGGVEVYSVDAEAVELRGAGSNPGVRKQDRPPASGRGPVLRACYLTRL
jgi:hypothetical protein